MYFKCGCGEYNYNWNDWISHFKYGSCGFWRALRYLLLTKIQFKKEF
jgi:hypothetical protein